MEKKYITDLQSGDNIYYMPGRSISNGLEDRYIRTLTVVSTEKNDKGVFTVRVHDQYGDWNLFGYLVSELECDTFCDKYGWYSIKKEGIRDLWNAKIEQDIKTCNKMMHDEQIKYTQRIAELNSQKWDTSTDAFSVPDIIKT